MDMVSADRTREHRRTQAADEDQQERMSKELKASNVGRSPYKFVSSFNRILRSCCWYFYTAELRLARRRSVDEEGKVGGERTCCVWCVCVLQDVLV